MFSRKKVTDNHSAVFGLGSVESDPSASRGKCIFSKGRGKHLVAVPALQLDRKLAVFAQGARYNAHFRLRCRNGNFPVTGKLQQGNP